MVHTVEKFVPIIIKNNVFIIIIIIIIKPLTLRRVILLALNIYKRIKLEGLISKRYHCTLLINIKQIKIMTWYELRCFSSKIQSYFYSEVHINGSFIFLTRRPLNNRPTSR